MLISPNRLMNPQGSGFSGGAPLMNGNVFAAREANMGDMLNFLGFKAFYIPSGTTGTQWLWQFGSFLDEDTELRHGCYAYLSKSGINNKWSLTIGSNKVGLFVPPDRYQFTEVYFARTQDGLQQFIIEENKWYWVYFEANFDDTNASSVIIGDQVTSGSYNILPVSIIVNTSGTGESSTSLGTDAFDAQVDLATEQIYSRSSIAHYGGFFDNAFQGGGSPERTFVDGFGWVKQVINPLGYQSQIEPDYNARYYKHIGYTNQYTVYGGQVSIYVPPPLLAT